MPQRPWWPTTTKAGQGDIYIHPVDISWWATQSKITYHRTKPTKSSTTKEGGGRRYNSNVDKTHLQINTVSLSQLEKNETISHPRWFPSSSPDQRVSCRWRHYQCRWWRWWWWGRRKERYLTWVFFLSSLSTIIRYDCFPHAIAPVCLGRKFVGVCAFQNSIDLEQSPGQTIFWSSLKNFTRSWCVCVCHTLLARLLAGRQKCKQWAIKELKERIRKRTLVNKHKKDLPRNLIFSQCRLSTHFATQQDCCVRNEKLWITDLPEERACMHAYVRVCVCAGFEERRQQNADGCGVFSSAGNQCHNSHVYT